MTPDEFNSACDDFARSESKKLLGKADSPTAAIYIALRAQKAAELYAFNLAERLSAIEAKGIASYEGVFALGRTYGKSQMVSWGGEIWACREHGTSGITPGKPGSEHCWVLAVKRGNDGCSAYQSAKKHGFVGSEAEWVDSIKRGNE